MEMQSAEKIYAADFDTGRKRAPLKSPLLTAGFFSRQCSWWLRDLLRKGVKRPLTLDDIYQLPPEQESAFLADALETEWRKERERKAQEQEQNRETKERSNLENFQKTSKTLFVQEELGTPSLPRAIAKVFWKTYLGLTAVLMFFDIILKIIEPLALGALVRYFNHRGAYVEEGGFILYRYWGFLMGSVIILSSVLCGLVYRPAFYGSTCIGLQIQTACSGLIFRKALRLSQFSLQKTDVGHIVNLLASDVARIQQTVLWMQFLWIGPLQFLVTSVVVYFFVGPSCFIGLFLLASVVPFQVWIGRKLSTHWKKTIGKSDHRIKLMSEIVNGIKLIKMWAWEGPFSKRVEEARAQEMKSINRSYVFRTLNVTLYNITLKVIVFLTLVFYVVVYQNHVSMETVFIIISLYSKMHSSITRLFPTAIEQIAETKVSISRIQNFLLLDEKPKREMEKKSKGMASTPKKMVDLRNATARWRTNETEDNSIAIQNINLNVEESQLVFLVGRVGSGKTSLLHAILEELPLTEGHLNLRISQGKIGYASQDSWLFEGSLKENILFGKAFEPEWYEQVIYACALGQDVEALPFGDDTQVGERGVKLSGGQKARVGLARVIYSRADLVLLDDPFSAVDVTTTNFLFKNGIQGLLKNKTRILVVHQTQFLKHADNIFVLKDGALEAPQNIKETVLAEMNSLEAKSSNSRKQNQEPEDLHLQQMQQQNPKGLKNRKSLWTREPKNMEEKMEKSTQNLISKSLDSLSLDLTQNEEPAKKSNLTKMEMSQSLPLSESESEDGQTQISSGLPFDLYNKYFGAGSNFCLLAMLVCLLLLYQGFYFAVDIWMTLWTKAEEFGGLDFSATNSPLTSNSHKSGSSETGASGQFWTLISSQSRQFNLWSYFTIISVLFLTAFFKTWLFYYCMRRSSQNLHQNLLNRILKAPISFFQQNSTGRILNRFSKDMSCIDNVLPAGLLASLDEFGIVVGTILLVSVINPFILIPIFSLMFVFLILWKMYIPTSQSLKRLEGITKSPILSHLANSVRGITTIRAFGQEENWIKKFDEYQNIHMATNFYLFATTNWFIWGLYCISFAFVSCVTYSFLLLADSSGSSVGLSISTALMMSWSLIVLLPNFSDTLIQMVSVERVVEYTNIQVEAEFESSKDKKPPSDWPKKGEICFEDVSLFYDEGCPAVLHNLSFKINPAEKIGIVGRTGAGKSSLISLLFRLTEATGKIFIDQVLINTPGFGLSDLRSKISIIAQDPILFTGSIRYNLDPFGQFSDDQLWSVLEKVQMKQSFTSLESQIMDGGTNLSFGQRQLVCIARALLRRNRILVMDEASANIDLKTDTLIHKMVDTEFADCTILCIAHRLHSVIYCDRVMVLDGGRILEFDEPLKLLRDRFSAFWNLVQETGEETANELLQLAQNSKNLSKTH